MPIIRLRSREKTLRVQLPDGPLTGNLLYKAVSASFPAENDFSLSFDPKNSSPISKNDSPLGPIEDGAFIFYFEGSDQTSKDTDIDYLLKSLDGRVKRENINCHTHGPNGMCEHCSPLEPYDPLAQKDAKHLSLYAYLKKSQQAGIEPPEYSIQRRHHRFCRNDHRPYPHGLCTKCQPAAIPLIRQPFRCTDHIEFHGSKIVDKFIGKWRSSGMQRFGWLIGKYELYDGVPLGVKADVHSIYEPPQEGAIDGFQLLPDSKKPPANVIGMIYTDLSPDEKSLVQNKRNASTFFVSSAECYFMAQQQLSHPINSTDLPCSRFVTAIITGNDQGQIDIFCYQVSVQTESLVRSNIVVPSTDPSTMMLGGEDPNAFIPSVIYGKENEYGCKVQHCDDKSFPVEYLLVNLTHGFINNQEEATSDESIREDEAIVIDSDGEMAAGDSGWPCEHCTFINDGPPSDSCSMCGLPRLH
jgi:nuclear protein localization protein 4 homolog